DILLMVDDIQAGCGRKGRFFSSEPAGLEPDIVCLSKSIGGYGLPMAITLMKRELDIFTAAEHNATFRGNNLAFIAATEAMSFWAHDDFGDDVRPKGDLVQRLTKVVDEQ